MFDVPIPDQIYERAKRAAEANHLTVAQFVAQAVQLHLEDAQEGFTLSPEQIAIIRKSQAEIKAGKGLTMEQLEAQLATKKAEWLAENPR